MEIVFTSSYKTFFKENTKNYTPIFCVLVFLISVIYFSYNLRRMECMISDITLKFCVYKLNTSFKMILYASTNPKINNDYVL